MPPAEVHVFVEKDGSVVFSDLPGALLDVVQALEHGGSGVEDGEDEG